MSSTTSTSAYKAPSRRQGGAQNATTGPGEYRFLLIATVCWFLVTFTRIQDIIPLFKVLMPGMLSSVAVTIAAGRRAREVPWSDPIVIAYLVMLGGICTGVFYALNTFWLFSDFLTLFTYFVVFVMALPILARSPYCLDVMVRVIAISALTTAIWGVTHSGHGQGAWLGDENDVALFLNVGVCFCYFAARAARSKGQRRFLLLTTFVCAAASVFSFSRGGFVGLAVGIVAIAFFSRRVVKVLGIAALIGLAALPLLATLHPPEGRGKSRSYLEELESINDKNDGTRLERIYTWTGGWVMYKANPIFGVGAGNYSYTLGSYENDPELRRLNIFDRSFAGRAAHSLYFTMLAELGSVGSGAFFLMWFTVLRRSWTLSRLPEAHPLGHIAAGVGSALLAYAACSAFVSAFYYPPFWLLCGFACVMRVVTATSQAPPPEEVAPKRLKGWQPKAQPTLPLPRPVQPEPAQSVPTSRR
jgi:O-antigen ligase